MARPLRIEFPGALYHLTARGNACADIFVDDDEIAFLEEPYEPHAVAGFDPGGFNRHTSLD